MSNAGNLDNEINKIDRFLGQWNHCSELINSGDVSQSTLDVVTAITTELGELLVLEHPVHVASDSSTHRRESTRPGPLLSITISENIFEKLLLWVEGPPSQLNELLFRIRDQQRVHLLTLFETLMTQSRQDVVSEISILRPLLQFLFKLSSQLRPVYSRVYGRTLYELCVLLCRDSFFLDHCRKVCEELFGQPHIVFSMLVPLIHQSDAVGDWARDAFLLVLSVSKRDDTLGDYLAFDSDFCPILAAGLSGLYSSLPKKLVPRHELPTSRDADSPGGPVTLTSAALFEPVSSSPCVVELPVGGPSWHQLAENEWNQSTDLRRFLHTLDFCNLVVKICHQNVRDRLLHFIYSGFLVPVLGSALHQSALDEVVAATAYLELFLRRLTEPALIKLVLSFIVNGTYDSYSILSSLINRLNSKAALGMVTLSLFRTILSFHCEDVMHELIFKYLVPLYDAPVMTTSGGDSSSQSSKTRQNSLWNYPREPEERHLSPTHTILDLIQSGDRFLALATTAIPDNRFKIGKPQRVSHGNTDILLNGESMNQPSVSFTDVIERPTRSEDGDMMDDWVLVQPKLVEFYPPEKPCLFPYLRCTKTRIRHRREACSAWHMSYSARCSDSSTALTVCYTDEDLEANECRDREDIHLSPKQNVARHVCSPCRESTTSTGQQPSADCDSRSNCDLDSPLPAPLTSMSRAQASSLYQLNYFDDSSEEEVSSSRPRENSKENTHPRPSNVTSSSASDISGLSPTANTYLPIKQKTVTDDLVCTCLTAPQALEVMKACLTPDSNVVPVVADADGVDEQQLQQQLDQFITSLNVIGSPWACQMHFGHLTPVETNYPKVDEIFFTRLYAKLEQSGISVPDSPTHVDALETSSLRMEMDSLHGVDISDGAHNLPVHSVRLSSPRESVTSSGGGKRTTVTPTAGGIGPFLWILLSRLSSMHTNCLFTNLLLTDLLTALAAYPCPLLYEFLLNSSSSPTRRGHTNSVYKCLHAVRNQLLSSATVIENWHSLIYRARLYLCCEKRFLTDMLIDPDFYCFRKQPHPPGRASISYPGARSTSVDRLAKRGCPSVVRSVWLPTDFDPGRNQPRHVSSSTTESDTAPQVLLTYSTKPSAFPNSLTPLLPVDCIRPKRAEAHKVTDRSSSKLQPRAASFSHAPPMVVRVGQHHLPPVSVPKQIWTRTARYALSPALRRINILPSAGSRSQPFPTPDSSESEDEEMHTVYQPEIPTSTRNLVFAAIIFDEFCHELASLCYNHSQDRSLFT